MSKCYMGDVGTIVLVDCGCNIMGATTHTLMVKKPDDVVVEWAATVYGQQYLRYTVQSGDFNCVGVYRIQANIVLGNWSGLGATATFQVHEVYH